MTWLQQVWRRSRANLQVFVTDTINIVRYAYLFTYLILGLLGSTLFHSAILAWIAFVVCAILSYAFGARLVLGATAFKMFKRLIRLLEVSKDEKTPNLLNVWYWQAFIAMWATAPLVALAVLRPWEGGRTVQLIAVIFMILHVVATQREVGNFWRRVYAVGAVGMMAIVIFAIVNPGDWVRISGSHQRGQNMASVDEGYQEQRAAKLIPQLKMVSEQLATVEYEENQAIAAGAPWSVSQQAHKQNLLAAREHIKGEIETLSAYGQGSIGSVDINDERSVFRMFVLLTVAAALIGGTFSFFRHLGKTTPPSPSH